MGKNIFQNYLKDNRVKMETISKKMVIFSCEEEKVVEKSSKLKKLGGKQDFFMDSWRMFLYFLKIKIRYLLDEGD